MTPTLWTKFVCPFRHSFFFYCSGYHLDLHSFPTRRSSDLEFAWLQGSYFDARVSAFVTQEVDYYRPWKDRKSTRLNSSHTVISYAVFCLKKKKRTSVMNYCRCRGTSISEV